MKNKELSVTPQGYNTLLENLKARVHKARMSAALAANSELVNLYLDIGQMILDRQASEGWGAKVIEKLAKDLRAAFPDMKGFSPRNFAYMRKLAELCSETPILQQVAAKTDRRRAHFGNRLLPNCRRFFSSWPRPEGAVFFPPVLGVRYGQGTKIRSIWLPTFLLFNFLSLDLYARHLRPNHATPIFFQMRGRGDFTPKGNSQDRNDSASGGKMA